MVVGEDLHFDVPRVLDVLFQVDAAVAERRFGLGAALAAGAVFRARSLQRHAHAPAAAAGRGLDEHRKADLVGRAAPLRPRR